MSKSEITLAILIDYSKAFDTIDYGIPLEKLYGLKFSHDSIQILSSYLCGRSQFIQIDDQVSSDLPMFFGVPQGSILGPVLFNLYVIELSDRISSNAIQYADDTTIYRHCKITDTTDCIKEIEKDLEQLLSWSKNHNLLFNSDKLQFIVFASQQLSRKLTDRSFLIRCSGISVEQKNNVKLLGIVFDQALIWNEQVNRMIKSSYGTLRALRKFGRFTPFYVRKSLAEALIISKLNYCNSVFGQMPKYLFCRLQKVQNITAGYVLSRYANIEDVINLKWLPVKELCQWNTVKLVHRSKCDPKYPTYLQVEFHEPRRSLRSSDKEPIVAAGEAKTFQEQAREYDKLPEKIRKIEQLQKFSKESKMFYLDSALADILKA